MDRTKIAQNMQIEETEEGQTGDENPFDQLIIMLQLYGCTKQRNYLKMENRLKCDPSTMSVGQ